MLLRYAIRAAQNALQRADCEAASNEVLDHRAGVCGELKVTEVDEALGQIWDNAI